MARLRRRVLTINDDSSSVKFARFEAGSAPRRILSGAIERVGLSDATLVAKYVVRVVGLNP